MPDRTFSCDVNRIGTYCIEPSFDVVRTYERQPDLRIARHRQGPILVGTEEFQFGAECSPLAGDMPERVDDAVDLRMPGVGGDKNLQAASALGDEPGVSAVARLSWVQIMTSNRAS